jgi:hypothetical protein
VRIVGRCRRGAASCDLLTLTSAQGSQLVFDAAAERFV